MGPIEEVNSLFFYLMFLFFLKMIAQHLFSLKMHRLLASAYQKGSKWLQLSSHCNFWSDSCHHRRLPFYSKLWK